MSNSLSVLLPVYNAMPHLPEAVESILRQSFTDFTLIIVNDGSTDGSGEYLSSLSDERIMLINQENQGQGAARTAGLYRCRSEYVALMDADDISLPDRFQLQINYLKDHPDVVMVGTQFDFLIGSIAQRALRAPINHDQIESRLLDGKAGFCNPSIMFRAKSALACAKYPSGILGEDVDFCLSMCDQGRVANLERVLMQYRLHASQTSLSRSREIVSANCYAAYRAACRRKGLAPSTFNSFLHDATWIDRWRWSTEALTLIHYRTARIQLASGKPIEGTLRLAVLGICRPFRTIRRVIQTFGAA